jgi:hypothetical protein
MANLKAVGYDSGLLKVGVANDTLDIIGNVSLRLGDANELVLVNDGSESFINSSDALKIGTTSNVAITLGGGSSTVTVGNNLTVSGDLTVNGTTTTVNSTVTTLDDPILTLGGNTAPGSDDNKDRGIEFRYYDSQARLGFMGWDDSAAGFTLLKNATNSAEVFSGNVADLVIGGLTTTGITLGATLITATGAEINHLDGSSANLATFVLPASTTISTFGASLVDDTDAATARTTLGVAIGSNVQAWDAQLDDIAALTPTDGNIIVGDGTNWVAESGATARASLGLTIGTDVQAYDAELAAVAGLTSAADKIIRFTGSGTADLLDFVDEDNMASDSATAIPSQQSVKAYVDTATANIAGSTISLTNSATALASTGLVVGLDSSANLVIVDPSVSGNNVAPIGVSTEAVAGGNATDVSVAWGLVVSIKIPTNGTITPGAVYNAPDGYLSNDAPTTGLVYRLGFAKGTYTASGNTYADVLWMPQFIADLG